MTILRFPSAGVAAVAPAPDALWTQTAGAVRLRLTRDVLGTPLADVGVAEVSAVPLNVLVAQYVSDPLAAQRIEGTARCVLRCDESNARADFRSQIGIRVVSNDGATVRGTLLAPDVVGPLASEWNTVLQVRKFPVGYPAAGVALSPVDSQDGDRFVVELGYRAHNTVTTSRTGVLNLGDPVGFDLPEDETSSAIMRPWLDLSDTIQWQHEPARIWMAPGFEAEQVINFETGEAERVRILSAPMGAGSMRVQCGSESWDVLEGDTGEKLTAAPQRGGLSISIL